MKRDRFRRGKKFDVEQLEPRNLLTSGPHITEFMARNVSTLPDEDGQFSDWIEIHNGSSEAIDLGGWHLTDERADLTKWRFPDRTLAADEYLVVFASGKNRASGGELHANFELDGNGEFLALVEPNGTALVSEFSTQLRQRADISYGVSDLPLHSTELVYSSSPADVLVPSQPPDASWTTVGYQVGADWSAERSSIGYQRHSSAHAPASVLYVADTDLSGDAAAGDQSVVDRLQNVWGHTVSVVDDDEVSILDALFHDLVVISSTVSSPHVGTKLTGAPRPVVLWEATLNDDFKVSDSGSILPGQDSITVTSAGQGHPLAANLEAGSHTVRQSPTTFHTAGLSDNAPGITWIATAANGAPAIGVIEAGQTLNNGASAINRRITTFFGDEGLDGMNPTGLALFDATIAYALEGDVTGPDFAEHFASNVQALMFDVSPSIFMRIPFEVADVADLEKLILRMKYDDGFVAYLNGEEVARRNAPAAIVWNSSASGERPDELAVSFEEINISQHIGLLNAGPNVLAIQGLNMSHDDVDFLLAAELAASGAAVRQHRYYTAPTPGAINGVGFAGFVADTQFSVDRGFYATAFQTEITTATPAATIRYTTDGSPPSETNGTVYSSPISVSTTTNLRAIAYKDDYISTNVDTHTYLFVADVLRQPAEIAGFPFGGSKWAGGNAYVPQDSEMDPQIVNDPAYADAIYDGLLSIPTMSITTDLEGVFTESGWYDGEDIEEPVSVEVLYPADADRNHQADAGIESHSHDRLKRSLRLNFRSEYGDASFETDLFQTAPLHGDTAVGEVDRIILRGGNNRSWARIWNPDKTAYTIDQFYRDSQIAMSGYGMRGNFVHLYINGVYWGLYNPVERADSFYTAAYFGGDDEDWFAVNHGGNLSGDAARWNFLRNTLVNRDLSVDDNHAELREYLDVEGFVDYLIISWWTAVSDWPQNNWYGGNRSEISPLGPTPFRYFAWDGEWSWGQGGQSSTSGRAHVHEDFREGRNSSSTIAQLWHAARANDDFMMMFTDRVFAHLFNDGVLTETNAKARWTALTDYVRDAVVAESARWGDAMETQGHPTRTRDTDWQREVNRILNLMTGNNASFIHALRGENFYPAFDPPTFNQRGGLVPAGFEVTLDNPTATGTVYYTLDGTDPRLPGGAVSPSALSYETPIRLNENALIKTRAFADEWSALEQVSFVVEPITAEQLAITEILYNPSAPNQQELAALPELDNDDFEFIELKNLHTQPIDLTGLHFAAGVEFTFPPSQLDPQEYAVVVKNLAAFTLRYGNNANVIGEFQGNLNNGGERLTLADSLGTAIHDFEYQDDSPWPECADGVGGSLELIDHNATPASEYGKYYRWRGSTEFGGSPGAAGADAMGVVINEVFAGTAERTVLDSIELFNTSAVAVDIGGWYLSNSGGDLLKYRIRSGTLLEPFPFGFVVIDENHFNPTPVDPGPTDFTLNTQVGDDIWLVITDDNGRVESFVDDVRFDAIADSDSLGRSLLSGASVRMARQSRSTLGCANAHPRSGPLVISEVQYNPGDPSAAALAIDENLVEDDLEFVEIHNPTSQDINLANWQIRGGIDFDFDEASEIAAGQSILVASFDPNRASNANRAAAFRTHYGMTGQVVMIGGFAGQLSDSGERITLQRPGVPTVGEPSVTSRFTEDEVVYDDRGGWPVTADGTGNSVQRLAAVWFGNQALAWHAASPSPGSVDFSGHAVGDLTGDSLVDAKDVDILFDEVRRSPTVTYYDLNDDGLVDNQDLMWLIQDTLGTLPGDANLNGSVDADDFNVWRSNQFQPCQGWATADFNGDGVTDGSDFNIWNTHRFQAAAAAREGVLSGHGETRPTEPRAALQIPRDAPAIVEGFWVGWIGSVSPPTPETIEIGENTALGSDQAIPLEKVAHKSFADFARRYAQENKGRSTMKKPSADDAARLANLDDWFAAVAGGLR